MTTLDTLRKVWGIDRGPSPILLPSRTRRDLAKLFRFLHFTVGAEVGVSAGQYSKVFCVQNPELHLLCVDSWLAYPNSPAQSQMDQIFESAKVRLEPFNATLVRKSSVDAARDVGDGSLDFVYIDASHLLADVVSDIAAWEPKVRSGGIIAGHDFTHAQFNPAHPVTLESIRPGPSYKPCHVIEAVYAWTSCYRISPWFVLDGSRQTASWMWVKA